MKIFLITRGSQGDVYPYLAIAETLKRQGHEVTLSIPKLFEDIARSFGLQYILQNYDDINTLLETATSNRDLLGWMQRVTEQQFNEFIPILERHDILVATNTEFAAPSIAEYCRKPFIRTAYAPFIPGKKIPPPVMPWPKPHPVIRPILLWSMLNFGVNVLTRGIINKNRKARGMKPVKDLGDHAPANAHNFLLFSPHLGSTDPDWKYSWNIGSYCFNDHLPYHEETFRKLQDFIAKDSKPVLFFTLGSCKSKKKALVQDWLWDICKERGYKMILGSRFWEKGAGQPGHEDLFLLDQIIPHCRIFPLCDGIIHHGGSGTTHSAGRAGKPQLVFPIFIDQQYWGNQVETLGLGPAYINMSRIKRNELETAVADLMDNPVYRENAMLAGKKIRNEDGIQAACDEIYKIANAFSGVQDMYQKQIS